MLRLREARKRHDPPLSQGKLAAKADVSERTIRRIEELGTTNTPTLEKIAKALGVSLGELFDGDAA